MTKKKWLHGCSPVAGGLPGAVGREMSYFLLQPHVLRSAERRFREVSLPKAPALLRAMGVTDSLLSSPSAPGGTAGGFNAAPGRVCPMLLPSRRFTH